MQGDQASGIDVPNSKTTTISLKLTPFAYTWLLVKNIEKLVEFLKPGLKMKKNINTRY